MEFKEFCRQRKRMCERYSRCIGCGLKELNSCTDISEMEMEEQLDAAEAIVQQWAAKHSEEPPAFTEDKPPKTYDQGLEDAWELAKKIVCPYKSGGMKSDEMSQVFNYIYPADILSKYNAQEAVRKMKEWEEKTQINIGDIVEFKCDGTKAVIIDLENDETVTIFTENGCADSGIFKSAIKKTGHNILAQLNALLEAVKGEQR